MSDADRNPLLVEEIPQTLEQLLQQVNKLFHCMTGPPRAYFELALQERPRDDSDINERRSAAFERLVYESFGWIAREPRANPGVEARLVMALYEVFVDARRQLDERQACALLFWRRPVELVEYDEGDSVRTRIYCRMVIPGAGLDRYARKEGELIPTV
jgi:hypothetical protein